MKGANNAPICFVIVEIKPVDLQSQFAFSFNICFTCTQDEWEWEQKLPRDYKRIIEMSKHPVPSTTKKDLHCLLSSGILLSKENVVI